MMSPSLSFYCFIIFPRDKLIYYDVQFTCVLAVESDQILKAKIKPGSTSGMNKRLSFLKPIATGSWNLPIQKS